MIPKQVISSWRKFANWLQDDQVEQDLIISASLVELFNHSFLKDKIIFRGGTALNKLILPEAIRYSEDIIPLLSTNAKYDPQIACEWFMNTIIPKLDDK